MLNGGGRLLLVDIPVKRSSHKKTTPKGGGIGIVLVALGYAVYNPLFSWIFPLVALALFSFYGDSKEISFKWRLFFQVVFIFFSLLLASIFIKPEDFYHLSFLWVFFIFLCSLLLFIILDQTELAILRLGIFGFPKQVHFAKFLDFIYFLFVEILDKSTPAKTAFAEDRPIADGISTLQCK